MTNKKRLLIVSLDRQVKDFLCATLIHILGQEVEIFGATPNDDLSSVPESDCVLTSGEHIYKKALSWFPGRKIIASSRIISGVNLEQVMMLPKGIKVLVVNHPRSTSEETICSLKDLGINHINYVPYWLGREQEVEKETIQTAITPGMGHLCPKSVTTTIDIGPRLISIESFATLLVALGLNRSYLSEYTKYHHYFLLESSRRLSSALTQAELLRTRSAVILNEFDEGIISVSSTEQIDLVNKAAEKIFGVSGDRSLVGEPFASLMDPFEKVADLIDAKEHQGKSAEIYNYRGTQLIVSKIPVISGHTRSHILTYRKIASIQNLEKDVRVKLAAKGFTPKYNFRDIWGVSERLKDLIEKATNFARTERSILIDGESGTGKELFAHAIHRKSLRQKGPFVAVNFAGISETLIESELFGYEEGAFTGAVKGGKMGLFEQAHGGTIFLDEIGDASPEVQSRLLRVLQEREVRKVGGGKNTPINVRVIAATNVDLHNNMQQGTFREDLYYRLGTLPVTIPPLRERPEDILYIFHKYQRTNYKIEKSLDNDAMECMLGYPWPGNVRELINTVEYTLITSKGNRTISYENLPEILQSYVSEENSSLPDKQTEFQEVTYLLRANKFTPEIVAAALKLLAENPVKGIGRNRLLGQLAKLHLGTTEGRIKRLLSIFRDCDLVEVGQTKQGTQISQTGQIYLNSLSTPPK